MLRPVNKSFTRASAMVLGGAVVFGGALVAAPANAVPVEGFTVSGTAGFLYEDGNTDYFRYSDDIVVELWDLDIDDVVDETSTSEAGYGAYAFADLEADVDYALKFVSEDEDYPAEDELVPVGELTTDVIVPMTALSPYYLLGGDITVTGNQVLGQTITATVAPFVGGINDPVDPTLTYQWGYSGGNYGDLLDGATSLTLEVPAQAVGSNLVFSTTARADGYAVTDSSYFSDVKVTAPQLPAAPAPVADSSQVDAYLAANYVEKIPAASAGLPASGLSADKSYTATIEWFAGDSFVDVYAYSAPRLVGSFPVVDGVVQVTLTPEMLAMIGSGSHTLVYVGQTSGAVQAVAFEIIPALASTGADLAFPLIGGSALLLLGGAILVMRRRKAAHV